MSWEQAAAFGSSSDPGVPLSTPPSKVQKTDGVRAGAQVGGSARSSGRMVWSAALNLWLGSFARRQSHDPSVNNGIFPAGHLPIGAEVGSICVCSWHVQGLSCARTAAPDHESHQQSIFKLVMEMLRHPTCRKHVLCLQGCWQTLREQIDHEFRDTRETFGVLQAGSDVEPDSQQAGASERTCGDVIWVFCFGLLAGVVLQEHQRSSAFQVIIYDTVALELKHFAAEQLLPDERAKARRACSTPATG